MKAIRYNKYGPPSVLRFEEVDKGTPAAGEVLVQIHAASVNPLDWHIMRASPFMARLTQGLLAPKSPKLGADLAGVVEAVGEGVIEFKPGDRVFGDLSNRGLGAFAEYACAGQDALTKIPDRVTFAQAAAVPVSAFTALQGLRDSGKIAAGEQVLINGASGGVGTFAVQIAKAFGAQVTGVCSTRNLELVKSIGADVVIDYTKVDYTLANAQYDLIFDAVGNRSAGQLRRVLRPGGRAVVAGFTSMGLMIGVAAGGLWQSRGGYSIGMMPTARTVKADLETLAGLMASGKVTPVIDRMVPFAQVADAVAYVETQRARGKVIVEMIPGATTL